MKHLERFAVSECLILRGFSSNDLNRIASGCFFLLSLPCTQQLIVYDDVLMMNTPVDVTFHCADCSSWSYGGAGGRLKRQRRERSFQIVRGWIWPVSVVWHGFPLHSSHTLNSSAVIDKERCKERRLCNMVSSLFTLHRAASQGQSVSDMN